MAIASQDWLALSRLLDVALSLPPSERQSWLGALDSEHEALKPVLRELLARDDLIETGGFLATLPKLTAATPRAHSGLFTGDPVGPYRLERELGSGGMASVWLAERTDGLLKRKVALKLPHLGATAPRLAQRLVLERDILATLEHPNIARLYDAGVAADGRPYLALEYVEGEPIDRYCESRSLESRLRLVMDVARAVAFAHSRLIVHRDLKPSNIQVDASGQVRLLDFGIAKLLDQTADSRSRVTQVALTPEFASPEQLRGERVGTASDVYSLGVVLYELLTGKRPYPLRDTGGSLQLARAILSSDPPRPSDAARSPAEGRRLRGDIDTIVLKALKKEPSERYATMAEFADDIDRHLRGEVVRARPDSAWYRTRKFALRHRIAVPTTIVMTLALAVGFGEAMRQAHLARANAQSWQLETRRARAVQDFLLTLFTENSDAQADPVGARQTTARDLLDRGAARVEQALQDSPRAEEEVLGTLGDMYRAVGSDDEAEQMMQRRLAVRRRLYGDHDLRVAESLIDVAQGVESTNDRLQAPVLLEQASAILASQPNTPVALRVRLLEEQSRASMYIDITRMRDTAHAAIALVTQSSLDTSELAPMLRLEARADTWLGDWVEAAALFERSLAEVRKMAPAGADMMLTDLVEYANLETFRAHIPQAEQLYREAVRFSLERNGAGHVDTIQAETRLAQFLHETSRVVEARELEAGALRKLSQEKGTDTPNVTGTVRRNAAFNLLDEGQIEAAATYINSDVDLRRRLYPRSSTLATAVYNQARLSLALGHLAQTQDLITEGWSTMRAALGPARRPVAENRYRLLNAQLQIADGNADAAMRDLNEMAAPPADGAPEFSPDRVSALAWLAEAQLRHDDNSAALASAGEAMRVLELSAQRAYYQTLEADVALRLGEAKLRLGEPGAACLFLERALALREANQSPDSPWVAQAAAALSECFLQRGELTRARALRRRAAQIDRRHPELGPLVQLPPEPEHHQR